MSTFHTQISSDLLLFLLQLRLALDLHPHPRQILHNDLPEDTADLLKTLPLGFQEQEGDGNGAHDVLADEQRVVTFVKAIGKAWLAMTLMSRDFEILVN